jgi:hypothetical protein
MPPRSPHDEPPGPTAPAVPSFASLRSASRRSAVDVLVGDPGPASPPGGAGPARPAPRPAEYGDLLRLGVRLTRAALGVPGCLLSRLRSAAGR